MQPCRHVTILPPSCRSATICIVLFLSLQAVFLDAATFKFQHHLVDDNLPGSSWGQTALVDLNKDNFPDFITGQSGGDILWYSRNASKVWIRRKLGVNSPSDVGGAVLDVDGDGWPDFVTGGAWYRNPAPPGNHLFERILFDADLRSVHDVMTADLDGDGREEVVTMSDRNNLRFYKIPSNPGMAWERHDVGPSVHAGVAAGDLDGDGDLDLVRSNGWFENADGNALKWVFHANIPFGKPIGPYPLATRCRVVDMDRDGDADLVMTENEIRGGAIAWLENKNGDGTVWIRHDLPPGDSAPRGAYHSLGVADFDGDGDVDVFTCEMEGVRGQRAPRWFIWENLDGKGGAFREWVILDAGLGGHEAVMADVDGDGDVDLFGKLWRPWSDNANEGRNHVDFLENRSAP